VTDHTEATNYAALGVDLAGAEAAKRRIGELVASTRTPLSMGMIGAFGGMVRVPAGMREPVLVMSTDGVGTKVLVAKQAGKLDTVGECLVNHSVNDILVHAALPIAFMDYLAGADLTVQQIAGLVEGIARGCRNHGMALAGGETASMPGLYASGDFDLAGTIIGVVEASEALHGDKVAAGDVLVGLASSGLHTNGYTLARKIIFDTLGCRVDSFIPELETTAADALLAVHRSYVSALRPALGRVHALAHITGGGIPGNLVRVLPEGCAAIIDPRAWTLPPLFRLLQDAGKVSDGEMREVFNCGIGMIAVVPASDVEAVRAAAQTDGVASWVIGEIVRGDRAVRYTDT
jgi:phosphoribosylformylglycinamidine cyclo-ligase